MIFLLQKVLNDQSLFRKGKAYPSRNYEHNLEALLSDLLVVFNSSSRAWSIYVSLFHSSTIWPNRTFNEQFICGLPRRVRQRLAKWNKLPTLTRFTVILISVIMAYGKAHSRPPFKKKLKI